MGSVSAAASSEVGFVSNCLPGRILAYGARTHPPNDPMGWGSFEIGTVDVSWTCFPRSHASFSLESA